jgi:hypothetical protein
MYFSNVSVFQIALMFVHQNDDRIRFLVYIYAYTKIKEEVCETRYGIQNRNRIKCVLLPFPQAFALNF